MKNWCFSFLCFFFLLGYLNVDSFLLIGSKFLLLPLTNSFFVSPLLLDFFFLFSYFNLMYGRRETDSGLRYANGLFCSDFLFSFFLFFPLKSPF